MRFELELPSFIFGLLIGLALMLVVGQASRLLFGGRRERELGREVRELRRVVEQKDHYVRKALEALKKEGVELDDEAPAPAPTRRDR
jgi:hypothetical protein